MSLDEFLQMIDEKNKQIEDAKEKILTSCPDFDFDNFETLIKNYRYKSGVLNIVLDAIVSVSELYTDKKTSQMLINKYNSEQLKRIVKQEKYRFDFPYIVVKSVGNAVKFTAKEDIAQMVIDVFESEEFDEFAIKHNKKWENFAEIMFKQIGECTYRTQNNDKIKTLMKIYNSNKFKKLIWFFDSLNQEVEGFNIIEGVGRTFSGTQNKTLTFELIDFLKINCSLFNEKYLAETAKSIGNTALGINNSKITRNLMKLVRSYWPKKGTGFRETLETGSMIVKEVENISLEYNDKSLTQKLIEIYDSDNFRELIAKQNFLGGKEIISEIIERTQKILNFCQSKDKVDDFFDLLHEYSKRGRIITDLVTAIDRINRRSVFSEPIYDRVIRLFYHYSKDPNKGLSIAKVLNDFAITNNMMFCGSETIDLLEHYKDNQGLTFIINKEISKIKNPIETDNLKRLIKRYKSKRFEDLIGSYYTKKHNKHWMFLVSSTIRKICCYNPHTDVADKIMDVFEQTRHSKFRYNFYVPVLNHVFKDLKNPVKIKNVCDVFIKQKHYLAKQNMDVGPYLAIVMSGVDEKYHSIVKDLDEYDKLNLTRAYKIVQNYDDKEEGALNTFFNTFQTALETRPESVGKWLLRIVKGYKKKIDDGVLQEVYDAIGKTD